MTTLICDTCRKDYSNETSITLAKSFQEKWEALCRLKGNVARGISPCPIIYCAGELILTE